ncbi:hypothetical protein ACLK11_09665 [Escherichia coli]
MERWVLDKKIERKQDASIGFILDKVRLYSEIRFDFFIASGYRLNKKSAHQGASIQINSQKQYYRT